MAAKPRVLIVNGSLYIGGAERVTSALCRGIDRDRFDVTVAHLKGNGPIALELAADGFDVVRISRYDDGRRDLSSAVRLRRLVVERGIDLIHSQDLHAMIDAAFCVATTRGLRHVSTFHFGNYPRGNRKYHNMESFFLRFPHRLVAVGAAQRGTILKTYGLRPERIGLVRNGVPDAMLGASAKDSDRVRRGAQVVLGTISTLIEQKAVGDLLQAVRILRDEGLEFRLVVVGDGHLRKELESMSIRLGLSSHVEFLGWVENAASGVLPWLDVFVQSSLWEAMSIVVLEAMSCGCSIVATRVGDNPDVIDHGRSGLLVAPGRPAELAFALREVIQKASLRKQLGSQAKVDYTSRYTAMHMCRAYEALYLNTLMHGRSAANQ